jgi:SAM-dependent methyltransferase
LVHVCRVDTYLTTRIEIAGIGSRLENMDTRLLRDQYGDSGNLSSRVALHARFSTNPKGWADWLFEQFDLRGATRILELGCGPGGLWGGRIQTLPSGCQLVLSDASPGMVSEARSVLGEERVDFQVIDAQAIPWADGSFDRVIANHMLYHISDLSRALAEIARVLTADGVFYAATNGKTHMHELHDIIRESVPSLHELSSSFTLENGGDLLRSHFGEIAVHRYDDDLIVSSAQALSAYVRSMGSLMDATEAQFREIDQTIADMVAREGRIAISKDSGLFVSTRLA